MQHHDDEDDIPADLSTLIRLGRVGTVTVKPPRVTVIYGDPEADDGDAETGPVRWLALRAGKTKKWTKPTPGEEVVLLCPDGQVSNGVALLGLNNDNNPPPGDGAEGELTEFDDGALIGYNAETHDLTITLPGSGKITITAPAGIALETDVDLKGSLMTSGALGSEVGATGTFSTIAGQTVEVTNGLITNIN